MAQHDFPDHLSRIVFGLLHYRQATIAQTASFRDQWHDRDLCPAIEAKLNLILDLFERYQHAAFNIQGIRDGGVDVLLRYLPWGKSVEAVQSRIGFQVKSDRELEADDWFMKLKAQTFEATAGPQMVNFYVLLCADLTTKGRSKKVQNALADLTRSDRVSPVGPQFAYTFLSLREEEIAAFVQAKLGDEDAVYLAAVESLEQFTPTEAAILIDLLVRDLTDGADRPRLDKLQTGFVERAYRSFPDVDRDAYFPEYDPEEDDEEEDEAPEILARASSERFEEDISHLEALGDIELGRNDAVQTDTDSYRAARAVILDAMVRYGYRGEELKVYTLTTLLQRQLGRADEIARERDIVEV
ncbi:hypothetical protein [Longimicrobium sp.]|uniref:hypothetical protein n=1 Tax=Longimicrobium sp. TaxID=2029185 RepID=UPI002E303101|nr:hypothetical protein [Longimicrobium sp.]HEX6036665.1 hypothetical protein [Longimicrobium sp.]